MTEDQIRAQAMVNELGAQRNLGWDNLARAAAEISIRDAIIAERDAAIAGLEKRIAELSTEPKGKKKANA